jgi:[ribosomal protein S18]-alanine N-acetyltransferase
MPAGAPLDLGPLSALPMDERWAREIAAWRYPPPYDVYDSGAGAVAGMLDPSNRYHAVLDGRGELVGFWCFGPDARVPGDPYPEDALDVGGGLRPDLTGRGAGAAFLAAALELAQRELAPAAMRATVAAFNRRSLRACERAGLEPLRSFEGRGGREFVVLLRPLPGGVSSSA